MSRLHCAGKWNAIFRQFQSEISFATDSVSQISFNAQIARRPCRYARPGVQVLYRHWLSSGSFATQNLQADAQLTVTTATPHPVARRVQTLATWDLFLWQHDQCNQQELKTNHGTTSAKTMMTRSLHKKPSLLLCDAMRCRVKDGDAGSTIRCFCWASSPTQYCDTVLCRLVRVLYFIENNLIPHRI